MTRATLSLAAALTVALMTGALTGCTLSPGDSDPHAQLPPMPGAGAPTDRAEAGNVAPQTFEIGAATPAKWWGTFACPALDGLVDTALAGNEDIKTADAALRQAQAQAKAAGAALAPQIDASLQSQRARTPESLAPPVADASQLLYSLHTAQLTVAYPLDIFGELRAHARSARASADVARAHLLAARQTVAANLVLAVITQAQLAQQISATDEMLAAARETLGLMRRRLALGAIGDADVAGQEAAVAALEGSLPVLVRAQAHQRAIVAVLLGRPPGSALPELPAMQCLALPAKLPVSLPADVVRNRPDVMAAAAQVQASAADARAAAAARFPSFNLTASAGGTAENFADMFRSADLFWSIAQNIAAPIFHGGALRAQAKGARAAFEGAKSQYRATVLQSFVDVSDALTGLHTDAEALGAAVRGQAAAQRALDYARRRQELGEIGSLDLLLAQTTLQQARLVSIQASAARLTDTVALYQANGAATGEETAK